MPKVLVFSDLKTLSRAAAEQFNQAARQAVEQRSRFLICLSGGNTPRDLYEHLGAAPYAGQAWWKASHLFWGDERCVPPQDAESCYGQVQRLLLGRVEVPPPQVHRILGECPPEQAVEDYRQRLTSLAESGLAWPCLDLVLLGMGTDGHTASLFPGSDPNLNQPVISVAAHYQNRPAQRISLTPPVFNSARQVWILAVGADKAETLAHVLGAEQDLRRWPVQRIRPKDGELIWWVDEAAAQFLPENQKIRIKG